MSTWYKILVPCFALIVCLSCSGPFQKECGTAWVGGEIVNPKKDYVIIASSHHIVDTVPLDENNFFLYQFEGFDPGLYFFRHNEYQALYLEPGDSIMLRVNTVEFDESLSFTGKGADRNNFMMDLFLLNEMENESMPKLYILPPAEFEMKIDSMLSVRKKMYDEFSDNRNLSNGYKEVAEASLYLDIYSKKELYAAANARKKIYDESVEIPESYYTYRNKVNMGNDRLHGYYPYYRYLSYYMDNLSFNEYSNEGTYDRNSFIHNYHKSILIDSLVEHDSIRNRMLRYSVSRYFLHAKDEAEEQKMLDLYLELSTSKKDRREVAELARATMQLTPGHLIPNIKLLTTENTVKDLHTIINRPSVIFFWSDKSIKHYRTIHVRAKELESKYPEYHFIGINIDDHFKKWLKVVRNSGFKESSEFQLEDFSDAEMTLIIDSVNKAMIVDQNGIILNGNTNLFDTVIESELLGYLNQ